MKNIFQVNTNNPYSVRSSNELYCRNPKTVKHGTEKYGYLAPKIWEKTKSENGNLIAFVVYVRLSK